MIEIISSTFTDNRTGLRMLQLTMKKDGSVASISTDYANLINKQTASSELCRMIGYLCDNVFKSLKD